MRNARNWTFEENELLKELYPDTLDQEIADRLGLPVVKVISRAKYYGLRKTYEFRSKRAGRVPITPEREAFIRANYEKMTNPQLAQSLGLTLTVTRNMLYQLGLKRMELEYWTEEQIEYLKEIYLDFGDTEIALLFEALWPKKKKWSKKHIDKKRKYLGLKRDAASILKINQKWWSDPMYTSIIKNGSASLNLPDGAIANYLAWRDPEKKKIYLQMPELLHLKRQELLLNRAIKQHGN